MQHRLEIIYKWRSMLESSCKPDSWIELSTGIHGVESKWDSTNADEEDKGETMP